MKFLLKPRGGGPGVALRKPEAFTLVELLIAVTILTLLSVMLFAILNATSTLWRVNESRVASFREARAAINFMSREIGSTYYNPNGPTVLPVFVVNPDGSKITFPAEAAGRDSGTGRDAWGGRLMFLATLPAEAQDPDANRGDLCAVGYYLAFTRRQSAFSPVATGSGESSYKLYRYSRSSDSLFNTLISSTDPKKIFQPIIGAAGDEILANNITQFEVRVFRRTTTGSLEEISPASSWDSTQAPAVVQIALTALNDETAARLGSQSDWEQHNSSLQKSAARKFVTRIAINSAPSPTP